MRESDEDYDDFEDSTPFPVTVTVAGIGWIVFGSLVLLNLLFLLAILGGLAGAEKPGAAAGFVAGATCIAAFVGLIGGAFIFVGIQSVRGTARDTLGNGIGSLVFGALNLGRAALIFGSGRGGYLEGGIALLVGLGLIGAGILALVGRAEYKAWRKAQKRRSR